MALEAKSLSLSDLTSLPSAPATPRLSRSLSSLSISPEAIDLFRSAAPGWLNWKATGRLGFFCGAAVAIKANKEIKRA